MPGGLPFSKATCSQFSNGLALAARRVPDPRNTLVCGEFALPTGSTFSLYAAIVTCHGCLFPVRFLRTGGDKSRRNEYSSCVFWRMGTRNRARTTSSEAFSEP
jgi:hypothetical protein